MTNIIRTSSDNQDFKTLVKLLDDYLAIKDGNEHSFYAQYNKIDKIKNVVVYYDNNIAVGCGAFKQYDAKTIEIKRMFVHPNYRSKGIGAIILNELEIWAKELNYSDSILETGKRQPEAIHLYQKAGYKIIPNYGQYATVENSVCMKKTFKVS
jgi:putative acetyltransferase